MKILIDESLDVRLKTHFENYDVSTARDMNWLGKKNGELLKLIGENNFDVFLTADKNLRHQQNLSHINFVVIVLNSIYSELSFHILLVPKVLEIINNLKQNKLSEKFFEVE
ncbi:MAG: DUF5615 family PIN-like protein [Ignavibacteria bacterium]|nr:DUF5615 family PIN-like protein [Ignavibacteria bacterium]